MGVRAIPTFRLTSIPRYLALASSAVQYMCMHMHM